MTINKKYLIPLGLIFSLGLYMAPGQASEDEQLKAKNGQSEHTHEHKHATTLLRVWASIGPLTYLDHAKVTIRNAHKEVIATGTTTSRGTVEITVSEEEANILPLTVSISGGQENGVPFLGHLSAEVSDVGKDANIVHVGILSTVATRLAKWKDTYPEALTAIRAKLGISPYAPVDVLRVHNNYVDYAKLHALVLQLGGFDKLIDKMVHAVESGTKITWPDVKPSVPSVNKASVTVANSTSMVVSAAPTTTSVMASTATTSTTATGLAAPTCTTAVGTNTTSSNASTEVLEDFGVIAGVSLLKMAGAPSAAINASNAIVGTLLGTPSAVSADTTILNNIATELDCISSQLSYLIVETGAIAEQTALTTAIACASGSAPGVLYEWDQYTWVVNNAAQFPIGPSNSVLTANVDSWKGLAACGKSINDSLFAISSSGAIAGWNQANVNMQNLYAWYTPSQVQQLQSFLSYWGTIAYEATVLNNEYYNYKSGPTSQGGDGINYLESIQSMTGIAYDKSTGDPIYTADGLPVCVAGTTYTSSSYCATQSNIANAFPGDLYSDEIGLKNGTAVSAYPGGLAIPYYSEHGDTVVQSQVYGVNPQQILEQYQHTFNWHDDYHNSYYNSPGPFQYWYWSAASATTPSLDQFNAQGINPGNTDSAIETFSNPKAPRTQIPTSTTAGMSDLLNAQTSGGMTAQQFFLSALQSDPMANSLKYSTTSNTSFLTSDKFEFVYWKKVCDDFDSFGGCTGKKYIYYYHFIMDSFIGVANNTDFVVGPYAAPTTPQFHVLMSRNFWPGGASASTYSPPNPLTAATLVPGKVTIGTATVASVNSISVSFTGLTPTKGALPVTYEAKCDDTGTGTFTATSAVSPIIVSGLTPYSDYNCSIAAVNAAGTGPVSSYAKMTTSIYNLTGSAQNTAQATSPSEPTNLTAAYTADSVSPPSGWINMSYNAPILNGGYPLQGYYASCTYPDGTYTYSGVVASTTLAIGVPATQAQATQAICSVVASNNYYSGTSYFTGHQNQYGPAAALVIGLPLAPNTPRWSTTPGMINVSYSAPSIASASPITGYTASCTATGYPTCTGAVSGSTYTIGVPNCDAGVAYQCSVAAENASGTGTQSMLTTVTAPAAIAPEAPTITSLTATNVSITANFIESNNGGTPITGYTLTCANTNSGVSTTATGIATPITLSSLTAAAGATYSCAVQAQNAVGSSLSSTVSSVTLASVPGAPTNLSLTSNAAAATITGTFTAPSNNGGSPITNYYMLCTDTLNGWTTASWGSPITVPTYYGVTTYSCVVQATNAYGYGLNSTASLITVQAVSPRPPTITSLTSTTSSITANFTAPGNNGGAPITGYLLTCKNTSSGVSSTATGTTSPITLSGLTSGATYSCTEQAQNAVGYGSSSAASTVTLTLVVPGVPTNVVFSQLGNNKIQASFSPPSDIASVPVTGYALNCGGMSSTGSTSPLAVSHANNCSPLPGQCHKTVTCTVNASNAAGNSTPSATSQSFTLIY